MSGHAGLRALLRGLLARPRRYRPLCCPGKGGHVHRGMTAQERGVWAATIDAAQRVAFVETVGSAGCDFWTADESLAAVQSERIGR